MSHQTTEGRVSEIKLPKPRLGTGTRGKSNGDIVTVPESYDPPSLANPGNVLKFNVGGGAMGHALAHENEAPFPLGLPEFFVRSFCPSGGVVCDPFTGSGTTGHAAILHGRRFVGCDIRPGKGGVETATRRLKGVTPGMFNDLITNVSEN